jgi:allantoate deiminase
MPEKLLTRLDQLFALGGGVGANRPALSAAEQAAHDLAAKWMRAAGLVVSVDPIGNLWGRLDGADPSFPAVWTGSHLDSVPDGGRFDGALGVVAGIEALERLATRPGRLRSLAVVAFRDEEGWRFGRGFLGSLALCGQLAPDALDRTDADGVSVGQALRSLGIGPPPVAGWLAPLPAGYVEVHVEQGPVLLEADAPLGIVSSIAGIVHLEATLSGEGGHAGTVPMQRRSDALLDTAGLIQAVHAAALGIDAARATVGALRVEPNASNAIARRVWLTIDARAPDEQRLTELVAAITEASADRARVVSHQPAVAMDGRLSAALGAAAASLGHRPLALDSGAGHDAGVLQHAGVPCAMLFVRSLAGGVSHCPAETSADADIAAAVDVLTEFLDRESRRGLT